MAKANSNSASEDSVGRIHSGINKAFEMSLEHMLNQMEEAIASEDPVAFAMSVNDRLLTSATKWVAYNEVGCSVPEQVAESPLSKKLKAVRDSQQGKVLSFTKEG